jgi:hypothetical protein
MRVFSPVFDGVSCFSDAVSSPTESLARQYLVFLLKDLRLLRGALKAHGIANFAQQIY